MTEVIVTGGLVLLAALSAATLTWALAERSARNRRAERAADGRTERDWQLRNNALDHVETMIDLCTTSLASAQALSTGGDHDVPSYIGALGQSTASSIYRATVAALSVGERGLAVRLKDTRVMLGELVEAIQVKAASERASRSKQLLGHLINDVLPDLEREYHAARMRYVDSV